jgi:hypothetical protein
MDYKFQKDVANFQKLGFTEAQAVILASDKHKKPLEYFQDVVEEEKTLNDIILKEVMENMTEFHKLPKEENKVIIQEDDIK